jgi:hypothetical protein
MTYGGMGKKTFRQLLGWRKKKFHPHFFTGVILSPLLAFFETIDKDGFSCQWFQATLTCF